MNKLNLAIRALMLTIAFICTVGCTKPDDPNNGGSNGGGSNGGNNGGGNGQTYTISVSASPISGGDVSGGGTYQQGRSCTVSAIAATDYTFTNWTEGGNVVSSDANYTFTVTGSRTLVANFTRLTYIINVSANPTDSGSVSGGGSYIKNQICRLTATAASGYTFANWTVNDSLVSTNPLYSFPVTNNCTLVANFVYIGSDNVLTGAINGKFTINANHDQVYFSKGNLQYTKSTQVWSFMEHQYDRVEAANQDVGYNYENQDIVSLFGYGTSGWNTGNELFLIYCYHPWDTDNSLATEWGSTHYFHGDLKDNADWGVYNAISNGGNQPGLWRTLTRNEWLYVFNTRSTNSGIRYAKACVNNNNGVILLPDDWNSGWYNLSDGASFNSNVITASQWGILEQHGAVFLPAAGYRYGTSVESVNCDGYYWSASCNGWDNTSAWGVRFCDSYLQVDTPAVFFGSSVRLVHDVD
ncbi:MAG: hypothetical protein J6P83_06885 [Bacteroidales bacterium]|nr:hypothetical protein [Bacteroidales bacterium]